MGCRRPPRRQRTEAGTARVLVSHAHDWALGGVMAHNNPPHWERVLKDMVDVVWAGLQVR
jgi:hypothetical protein